MLLAAAIAFSVLQVPDASAQTAVRIVALGASNTDGWGVDRSESLSRRNCKRCCARRGIDATVRNAGIPGDTTGGMLARLGSWLAEDVRLVILQPGTNDERMGLGAERACEHRENARRDSTREASSSSSSRTACSTRCRAASCATIGIHFTPAGYAILAERILPDVLAALGK